MLYKAVGSVWNLPHTEGCWRPGHWRAGSVRISVLVWTAARSQRPCHPSITNTHCLISVQNEWTQTDQVCPRLVKHSDVTIVIMIVCIPVRPLGTSFRYPVGEMPGGHHHYQDYGKPASNHNLLYRGPKTVSVKRRAKSSGWNFIL